MKRKKILIVDDEPDVISILKFRLQQEGYDVIEAGNGLEGLYRARQDKPDLIILDVMMPKIDGFKVSQLLKLDSRFKYIPVLMLTDRGQVGNKKTGFDTDTDVYMFKPFALEELIVKINEMVNNHKLLSKVA